MKAPKIEFIKYDGKYPCLCYGKLTLKVNDEQLIFGGKKYPRFWTSGGDVGFDKNWNEHVSRRKWNWYVSSGDEELLPREIVKNKGFVMKLFNKNVPFGCCGGCV